MNADRCDVLVVGGGPAGLTLATELRRRGVDRVVVLERESASGGIPRHSDHTGFGTRDLHRVMTGPSYAAELTRRARDAGVEIRTQSMVTGWCDERGVDVTAPGGRHRVHAEAVVLATGARERPRPARWVSGDRPSGVLTTGQLQQLVSLHGRRLSGRAVVVGAEAVSWSAVLTLRHAGCRTTLMTTEHPHVDAYAALSVPGRLAFRPVVATETAVVRVIGSETVEAVEVVHRPSGRRRIVPCEVVVFTGDWVPDNELARLRGVEIDHGYRGPVVDASLRTSAEGVFAVGNLVHPVDTADVAALSGRHAAEAVLRWLEGDRDVDAGVRLRAEPPFAWVSPGVVRPSAGEAARGRALLWSTRRIAFPVVEVRQAGRVIASRRLPWPAAPGRPFRVPWSLLRGVDQDGGDASIGVRGD